MGSPKRPRDETIGDGLYESFSHKAELGIVFSLLCIALYYSKFDQGVNDFIQVLTERSLTRT